jgi:hypothetical protein
MQAPKQQIPVISFYIPMKRNRRTFGPLHLLTCKGMVLWFALLAWPNASVAQTNLLRTDASWRTIKGVVAVPSDWNSAVTFDDSAAAGWTNSFKAPVGDRIWNTSNLSSESPANPRFRHVFALPGPASSATAHFHFDDDATVWVNGTEVINDTDGHATTFDNVVLAPSLFHPGQNLIAAWGHNKIPPYNTIEIDISLAVTAQTPLLHAAPEGGGVRFSWDALTGVTYQLQYRTNLTLAAWTNLGAPITATTNTAVGYDSSPDTVRFYRLMVVP